MVRSTKLVGGARGVLGAVLAAAMSTKRATRRSTRLVVTRSTGHAAKLGAGLAFAAGVASVGGWASSAMAGPPAYDAISGRSLNAVFISDTTTEWAQDTTLASGAVREIESVRLALMNVSTTAAFSGRVIVGLYARNPATQLPGSFVGSRTVQFTMAANEQRVVDVGFGGLLVPTEDLWTTLTFPDAVGGRAIVGIRFSNTAPAVGQSVGWSTRRLAGSGDPWLETQPNGSVWGVQIVSVPGPGAMGMLACVGVVAVRRRR